MPELKGIRQAPHAIALLGSWQQAMKSTRWALGRSAGSRGLLLVGLRVGRTAPVLVMGSYRVCTGVQAGPSTKKGDEHPIVSWRLRVFSELMSHKKTLWAQLSSVLLMMQVGVCWLRMNGNAGRAGWQPGQSRYAMFTRLLVGCYGHAVNPSMGARRCHPWHLTVQNNPPATGLLCPG